MTKRKQQVELCGQTTFVAADGGKTFTCVKPKGHMEMEEPYFADGTSTKLHSSGTGFIWHWNAEAVSGRNDRIGE